MRWFIAMLNRKELIGAVVPLLLLPAVAFAAPISYIFSGTTNGQFSPGQLFFNAPITIVATGDDSNIPYNIPVCSGFSTLQRICNSVSSVTFTISGVASGTVTEAMVLFNNRSDGTVGLARVNGLGDWLGLTDPAFVTYGLATSIGPVAVVVTHGPFGGVSTTAGTLFLDPGPNIFRAISSRPSSVPANIPTLQPISLWLLCLLMLLGAASVLSRPRKK